MLGHAVPSGAAPPCRPRRRCPHLQDAPAVELPVPPRRPAAALAAQPSLHATLSTLMLRSTSSAASTFSLQLSGMTKELLIQFRQTIDQAGAEGNAASTSPPTLDWHQRLSLLMRFSGDKQYYLLV
ncbi:hypothetical protein GQ55_9G357200 [Panicum hallii var. hallii]|uniref:Uncharacterized protein n=1 Tax=Panicum hallii var. hallii TaxID=1504633 RepID=A0A2T7C8P0_9POAL|nr:hypothetical protein GQ55_9G357200 [Panicum hallii var. hallii]